MTTPPEVAPLIGQPLDVLPTPCVLIDPAALEANLNRLASYFAGRHAKLRPHFKSHKCVTLARRQLQAGSAVGITCAKLSEAEQLVAGGVKDVLIANQVVGAAKAGRLARLNRTAEVRVAVDSADNVADLSIAAGEAGVTIGVLVEVDIGMGRCGVSAGEAAGALARAVAEAPSLRFDGLQGYEGHLISLPDAGERARRVRKAMRPLIDTRRALDAAGLGVRIVSGGGTGTYDITGNIDGVDEIQCGTYALMDAMYKKLRPEFDNALSILATVISAGPGKAVADVGLKGMGCEFGPPTVVGHPEAKVRYTAEEHTVIDGIDARVGRRIRLIPSHGCTTMNLYRRAWIVRDGTIEDGWPIEGSGRLE